MDRLHKFFLKQGLKKYGTTFIEKIEKVKITEGVYLNFLNTGIKINLSEIVKKGKDLAAKEGKKLIKRL